jgi:ribosomal protein RSM22 (predicted rRNA methylase)
LDPALPPAMRAAIATRLEGVARSELARAAERLSRAYRGGAPSAAAIASPADVTAYLVTRLPATYAAITAALAHVRDALPDFAPSTLIDVGAGPGTATWAAAALWPALAGATLVERDPHFLDAAATLAASDGAPPTVATARRLLGEALTTVPSVGSADIVIASYALGEMAGRGADALVDALWQAADGLLVLVEPGTPDGYRRIASARARLLAAGATIAAPCAHDRPCPIAAPDWCHFAVRLPRSRDHRLAKGADAPFEDEKFSWVAAVRLALAATRAARVLAPPRVGKADARLKLCTPDGAIAEVTVARRDKAAFAVARRLAWGDAVDAGFYSGA